MINHINNSEHALRDDEQQQLTQLINQLDPQQSLWLSGYLAARAESNLRPNTESNQNQKANVAAAQNSHQRNTLTVLYGSQTGNGASIAEQLEQQAKSMGITTELYSLADFKAKQLTKKSVVTLVISTHGEGEAPDDAELFYEQLFSNKAPALNHLKYGVLALGDSSYELFCQTGKEIDQRLADLGAQAIHQRVDCDVDFDQTAAHWMTSVLAEVKPNLETVPPDNITALPVQSNQATVNKNNPFLAEILTIQKITGRGSTKNTFHLELAIDPDLIQYQPGDSVGVIADNNPNSVQQLLEYWQVSGTELFNFKNQTLSLLELLTEQVEITQISKPFIQYLASQINQQALQEMNSSHAAYTRYCEQHQLIDLLRTYDKDHQIPIQEVLNQLKSITPRLYSIASAQSVTDDEVHLTINLEPATPAGHYGLASGLLCKQLQAGDEVAIYIEANTNFRLPEAPETPIIMIGPGTGVAPFRAFMQQRQATNSTTENWLVFGNPNFSTDFLYQAEWLKFNQAGLLPHISVAFSRDQADKFYVQDKLKQQATQVWQWLEKGAHIYLCGDASRMAQDVEQTIITVISEQGQMSTAAAKSYLKQLKQSKRYQKDVY